MPRFALVAGALLVGLPAAIVVLNLFDRELAPAARAYFESGAPPKFSRDTGWALLMGFDAPQGKDPREQAGIRHKDVQRETQGYAPTGRADAGALAVRGGAELLCTPEKSDCIELFKERPESIAELVRDNATLLARYEELYSAQGLADASGQIFFVTPSVPMSVVMDTQRVRLSQVAALATRGKSLEAAALLEADAAFFRRWLVEGRSLLVKMTAVRGLARDFLLAAEIARATPKLPTAVAQALERVSAPLSSQERAFASIMRGEAYIFMAGLDRLVADPRKTREIRGATPFVADLAGRTLRRGDTLNRIWPMYAAWEKLDGADTREIVAATKATHEEVRRLGARDWTAIYNFAGRSIVGEEASESNFGAYFRRVRDLDALAATARCVIALHAAGVAQEAAAEFIARGGAACTDPLSGKSFTWDAGRNLIGFRPADADNVRRFGGAGKHVAIDAY